jgi:hypothetical protein
MQHATPTSGLLETLLQDFSTSPERFLKPKGLLGGVGCSLHERRTAAAVMEGRVAALHGAAVADASPPAPTM